MEGLSQDNIFSSGFELEEDDSLTCPARRLEASANSTFSSPVGIALRVVQVLYLILVLISGTILNILVVYLVSRSKKLRTSSCSNSIG